MGVRDIASAGGIRRPGTGRQVVVWLLTAMLAWPAFTWSAAKPSANSGAKSSPPAKATSAGGAASAGDKAALVREIRHWSQPAYTRIVIDVDGTVTHRAGRLYKPDRLYFDLLGARLAAKLHGRALEIADPIVNTVRAAQNQPDVVRVVLELKSGVDYHVSTLHNPSRLVIDLGGVAGAALPPQANVFQPGPQTSSADRDRLGPPSPPATAKRSSTSRQPRWHVVIDAGHGGKDPGAISPSGLLEKDLVLDIAKRLRHLMQRDPQWRVTLTRETDVFIPLEQRPAVANARGADLFVSIHANAAERPDAHGIETYFLDFGSDEHSMRVAARENATTLSKVNDLQRILRDLSMTSKRNESSLLAGSVQRAMVHMPGTGKNGRDLGVKHAPFLVLMGAEMPAILVEIGFLSHPGEERKLGDTKYRDQVARAILEGIEDYLVSTTGNLPRQVQR
jgi:N-acetylmuramoyl-L-alanine amidase